MYKLFQFEFVWSYIKLLEFLEGHLSQAGPQASAKEQQQSVLDKDTVEDSGRHLPPVSCR